MSAPLELLETEAISDWTDYNGHMNVAYYVKIFDQAMDEFLNIYGLGKEYTLAGDGSVYALQNHIHYLREVAAGTRLGVNLQFMGIDTKRFHVFFRMRDLENNEVVSTSELLGIHVDLQSRRSARFPDDQRQQLDALLAEHSNLGMPELAGHRIGTSAKL